jgi:glutathione synthase
MRFLFVMDPAESMLPDKDTTFAFIRSAIERGHEALHCLPGDLFISASESARVQANVRKIRAQDVLPHVTVDSPGVVDLSTLDAVFVRKDPPFDTAYLHLTQMLDLVKDQVLVLNDPVGLRAANEKLFALRFAHLMPKTLVTRERQAILDFTRDVGGRAVLKPLDGAGGSGVVALTTGDKNARALTDILTHEGRELAMVQEYRPEIEHGDKRVLVLGGRLLGAILRVPRADDLRANIHVGGQVYATTLTAEEVRLVGEVGPALLAQGLYFVGLDLIGGKLIEVNVTSPTGIQELGRLTGSKPEAAVIEWVESRVTSQGRTAAEPA